jgi:hypothetical protein
VDEVDNPPTGTHPRSRPGSHCGRPCYTAGTGAAFDPEELVGLISARIAHLPTYRHKVCEVPARLPAPGFRFLFVDPAAPEILVAGALGRFGSYFGSSCARGCAAAAGSQTRTVLVMLVGGACEPSATTC